MCGERYEFRSACAHKKVSGEQIACLLLFFSLYHFFTTLMILIVFQVEVFNLLFVRRSDNLQTHVVHCLNCARRLSEDLENFVVLNQYHTDELMRIYDQFTLVRNFNDQKMILQINFYTFLLFFCQYSKYCNIIIIQCYPSVVVSFSMFSASAHVQSKVASGRVESNC